MLLEKILTPQRCYCQVTGVSKKRLLKTISELIESNLKYLSASDVFDALMAREQLGSTGLGGGVAIPHCRLGTCERIIGALVTLDEAIDFDAVDSKPVDLLFFLIVPEEKTDEHLQALAQVAEMFNDENLCYILRHTFNSDDLYNVVVTY